MKFFQDTKLLEHFGIFDKRKSLKLCPILILIPIAIARFLCLGARDSEHHEESVSISVDETSKLCQVKNSSSEKTKEAVSKSRLQRHLHPNVSIVPPLDGWSQYRTEKAVETDNIGLRAPPHTFFSPTAQNAEQMSDGDGVIEFDHLVDRDIECKFTVIGSPMANDDGNGTEDIDDDEDVDRPHGMGRGAASKSKGNAIWEFGSAGDLIKGLSGVQHSVSNPLWMDLVCDRNTFIQIAEVCVSQKCLKMLRFFENAENL